MNGLVILASVLAILWMLSLAVLATYNNKDEAKTHMPEQKNIKYEQVKPKKLRIRGKK